MHRKLQADCKVLAPFYLTVNYAELAALRYSLRPRQRRYRLTSERNKVEQFLLLFQAFVFLIQPRNEYPVVDFIATRAGQRIPWVVRGYRRQSSVSPTFPLKKIVLGVSGRYLRPQEIVLSRATGYKHPSGANSYERREGRRELPTLLSGYCVKPRDAIIFYHLRPCRLILSFVSELLRYKVMLLP